MSKTTREGFKILHPDDGLLRVSVPGETLRYKVTGDDTDGRFDYLVLEIQSGSGPPLHVHDVQHETVHFLSGRFKVQAGSDTQVVEAGSFLWVAPGVPHAFLNVGDTPGQCVLTYTPGHSDRFFEEFGPVVRSFDGPPDPAVIGPIFERHSWRVIGPPLSPDV